MNLRKLAKWFIIVPITGPSLKGLCTVTMGFGIRIGPLIRYSVFCFQLDWVKYWKVTLTLIRKAVGCPSGPPQENGALCLAP
ncbi:hypothetical protein D3C85_1787140 [compost metagenome]